MTGKEIVRAMLRGETPERLAWAPCIDPYVRAGLPEPLRSFDVFELQRHFGSDLFRGAWACGEHFDLQVRHLHQDLGDGTIVDTYETPLGTLREVHRFVPESPYIPFPTEYLIKSPADLDVYLFIVEHTQVIPDHDRLHEVIAAYPDVMVTAGVTDTPLPVLMTKLIGIENFVQMYFDDPERIERVMQVMQAKHRRLLEAAVAGPAELFICYENTNTSTFGLDWIERYELPFLDEYADIAHAHGKHLLVHMCGRIQRIIERLAHCRFDGIIDVAPPPTGDCDVPRAVATLATRGKLLGGGIDCTTFVLANTEEFSVAVTRLIDGLEDPRNFLLGSGDAVPCGTSEANLLRAGQIAKRRGLGEKREGEARRR